MNKISMDKKYQTRDGKDVELITVEGRKPFPVVGYIGDRHCPVLWSDDGFSREDYVMNLVEVPEEKPWPRCGSRCYVVWPDGTISKVMYSGQYHDNCLKQGHLFRTEAEAKRFVKKQELEAELRSISSAFQRGVENWFLTYIYDIFVTACTCDCDHGVYYVRDKEVLQDFIDKHREDLHLLFNLKDA